ncbi:unnamed protein product, partial [Urochloa humidicola]
RLAIPIAEWEEHKALRLYPASSVRPNTNLLPREFIFDITPNGCVRNKIGSWNRGVLLGSGSFGKVYEGISSEGFFFAVKEVSLFDQWSNTKQCTFQLEQEIVFLSQFRHENLVEYYGAHKDDSKLYIFL